MIQINSSRTLNLQHRVKLLQHIIVSNVNDKLVDLKASFYNKDHNGTDNDPNNNPLLLFYPFTYNRMKPDQVLALDEQIYEYSHTKWDKVS